MFRISLLALLLFALACGGSKNARPADSTAKQSSPQKNVPVAPGAANIHWLDSERLMPVLEMATRLRKPVFVEFYAQWCVPCKVMEEEIFTQKPVADYLNKHFLSFRTDFDSPAGRTIAEIYVVEKLPTVLFLAPNGVEWGRHTGIANPSVLFSLGDAALLKIKQ